MSLVLQSKNQSKSLIHARTRGAHVLGTGSDRRKVKKLEEESLGETKKEDATPLETKKEEEVLCPCAPASDAGKGWASAESPEARSALSPAATGTTSTGRAPVDSGTIELVTTGNRAWGGDPVRRRQGMAAAAGKL